MTRPNNSTLKNVAFYAACFAFSVALFVALAAAGHVYPFGDNSFLTNDLKYQYIDFFAWFRRVLLGEANLRYSFSQGLGMNTWGLYSYYLGSPFNLLCVLFPADKLTLFVLVISALKLGCIHISGAWYVQKRFDLPSPQHSCFPSRSRFVAGPSATCATRSGSIASSCCPSAPTDATSSSASSA